MELPVKVDDIIELRIEDLNNKGEGAGKYKGYTVFVPGALPGEMLKCRIISTKKNYSRGVLYHLKESSPQRIEPTCQYYNERCGGCQLQHLSYEGQLNFKENKVKNDMWKIGKIAPETYKFLPIISMDIPWNYRNKIQLPVREINGKTKMGFFKKSSHELVEVDSCLIQEKNGNKALKEVKKIVGKYQISPYNEKNHKGLLRHIVIRVGTFTGEVQLVFVTRQNKFPDRKKIVAELSEKIPGLVGIIHNINPDKTNVVMGEKEKTIWGRPYLRDKLGKLKFNISPRAFYQVNAYQAKRLYEKSLEIVRENNDDLVEGFKKVIDAYCGIGTIALYFALYAREVIGVEEIEEAIKDAEANAGLNNLDDKVTFYQGKVEEILPSLEKSEEKLPELIVLDPPRKGCDPQFIDTILDFLPWKILYISCNPSTLSRDLNLLLNSWKENKSIEEPKNYDLKYIQPVDMFPHTIHVECIALLERN